MRNSRLMAAIEDCAGRVIRYVDVHTAFAMVDGAEAYKVAHQRFRLRSKTSEQLIRVAGVSAPTIMRSEVQANAGCFGTSRTSSLVELAKVERINRGVAPEDFIELSQEKIRLWPEIGDTKAVRVGPIPCPA